MIEELLEVTLPAPDNFLKIKETLTRIGVENRDKRLVQTCHILHKRGKYYICHFRELFKLDGFDREITEDDIQRRNAIAKLLEQWNLCEVVTPCEVEPDQIKKIRVIPFKDKHLYTLKSNYTLGGKK